MYELSNEMKAELTAEAPKPLKVWTYLYLQHEALMRGYEEITGEVIDYPKESLKPHPHTFFNDSDLEQYAQAKAWWPTREDLPEQLRCPTVYDLCKDYYDGIPTFLGRLTEHAQGAAAWCSANPETPSADQHSVATASESAESEQTYDERVKALHAAYMAACATRKAIAAEQDEIVRTARKEWETLKNTPPKKK